MNADKKKIFSLDFLHNLSQYRHAADGRHPVRRSRIYKGASHNQTPPFGGVVGYIRNLSLVSYIKNICVHLRPSAVLIPSRRNF
jgi:hypothetical protein